MGFSISWLAVRGVTSAQILPLVGARGTGQFEDIPESPLLGADLPDGWYLLFANRFDFLETAPLGALSADTTLVGCAVEEHVMTSYATGWYAGRRRWLVVHEAERSIRHLHVEGDPPPEFVAIRARQTARQDAAPPARERERGHVGVDYVFDVPVELARALTGFRHDRDVQGPGFKGFERLER